MDQRSRFIDAYLAGGFSMTELCARYQTGRRVGYTWLERSDADRRKGRADRSRAPHHCPHTVSDAALGMVLATEIVDWRRFDHPRKLACYLGLISREDSSGNRTRLGSITKAGNSHCRHVLVQAAWSYRHRPATSVDLKRRQAGQPPAVITHAWKAQQRLHQRFNHVSYRKRPQIAVVAVARERIGLLWAVLRDVPAIPAVEVQAA